MKDTFFFQSYENIRALLYHGMHNALYYSVKYKAVIFILIMSNILLFFTSCTVIYINKNKGRYGFYVFFCCARIQ